jgi:hypothetical protein
MAQIKKTIVLNSLQDNAADFFVDANGNLQITGTADTGIPRATNCNLTIVPAVAEVLGVMTVTIGTATVGTIYRIGIEGNTSIGGGVNPNVIYHQYQAVTGDTVTSIALALRNKINANVTTSRVTATSSAGDITVTAVTGFASFDIINPDTNPLITITNTTVGVNAVGNGAALAVDKNYIAPISGMVGSFTTSATYARIDVYWQAVNGAAAPSSTSTAQNTYSVFINTAGSVAAGSVNTYAMNYAMILGNDYSYVGSIGGATITNGTIMDGTATALQNGQRLIITPSTTTTAAITVTTGAIAIANTTSVTGSIAGNVLTVTAVGTGGIFNGQFITGSGVTASTRVLSQISGTANGIGTYLVSIRQTVASTTVTVNTNLTNLDVAPSDVLYISVSGTTAFTTYGVTAIKDMTSSTAATGTCITAISAGVFKLFQYRNMPR